VMVLYLFVVAYIGEADEPLHRPGGALRVLSPLFGLAIAIELCIAVLGTALKGINSKGAPFAPAFGTPKQIGQAFLTQYLLPFELASLLLLVAAIGAVVLARRRRGLDDGGLDERLHARLRPAFTGTMAESGGIAAGHIHEAQEVTIELPDRVGASSGSQPGDSAKEGGW
jgi:NADH-quinone oxidoreductase subunit J